MPISATLVMIAAALITAGLIVVLVRQRAAAASPDDVRILAEHVVDMVSTHDADGRFRYVSSVLAGMLGEYPGTLVGKEPAIFAHPEDAPLVAALWKRAVVWTGTPATGVWRCRRHNGEYVWLESTARAAPADLEGLGAIVCVSRDVSERKQIEDALRDSEQRFRSALETVRLVAVGLDPMGHVTFCNDALCTLTGWTRAELIGENWFERCIPPGDTTRTMFFENIVQGTMPPKYENEIVCRDGTHRVIQWDNTVLRTPAGDVTGTASLGADVTTQRKDEATLKLLQSITFAISSTDDLNAALALTLESVCTVTGWGYGEAWLPTPNGEHLTRTTLYVAPDVRCDPLIRDGASKLFARNEGLLGLAWQSRNAERRDLASTPGMSARLAVAAQCGFGGAVAVPVVSGGDVVAVLGFFMTRPNVADDAHTQMVSVVANQVGALIERKRAQAQYEAEILRARDAAEKASHAKSDFLSRMSHELRTPLNSVIGFANVMKKNKSGRLTAEELAFLDRITANGQHLLALVNNVLDIAKVEAGRMTVTAGIVAVDRLIHDVAEQIGGQPRAPGVELRVDVPEEMVPIETDGVLLRQVLINLTGNALRFTHEGSVVLAADVDRDSGAPLRIHVRDTGVGIPADRLEAIFEPFEQVDETTHRKYGGTGLGLAISKAICDALGFRLTVESVVGRGSVFTIHLTPVSESDRAVPDSDTIVRATSQRDTAEPQRR